MSMRRVVQAALCATVLWFGVLEFGGGFAYKGIAADESVLNGELARPGTEAGIRVEAVSRAVQTRPLLGVPGEGKPEGEEGEREHESGRPGREEGRLGREEGEPEREPEREEGAPKEREERTSVGSGAEREEPQEDDGKVVYLTFDDGPSKHTPEVLDILKREGVAATFFVLGEQVERNPATVRRIVEEGHAVGNHTYNHVYEQLYGSFDAFAEQMMRTDDAIYDAAGIRTVLVRAPGGTYANFDKGYFEALRDAGYVVHDWNVDSGDSKRRGVPAAEIAANIEQSRLADTLNVLLHDSAGHEQTVKALPDIIRYYKKLGYTFKALDEDVQPMQFALAPKTKWNRGAVKPSASAALAAFAQEREARSRSAIASMPAAPSLLVHYNGNAMELTPDRYTLEQGTIHVPLRELMEWMGGSFELDETTGVIGATLRGKEMFWIVDAWPPANSADTAEIQVPIRATLANFGIGIADYSLTKERREIWVQDQPEQNG